MGTGCLQRKSSRSWGQGEKGRLQWCNTDIQGRKITGECCQELAKGKGLSGTTWVNVQILNIKVIAEFMSVRKKGSKTSHCVSVWIFMKYMNYKIPDCWFCLPVESKINPRDTAEFDTGWDKVLLHCPGFSYSKHRRLGCDSIFIHVTPLYTDGKSNIDLLCNHCL